MQTLIVCCLNPYSLLLGLQDSGELVYICRHTLLRMDLKTENRYHDFVGIPNYAEGHHILAVTETNETGFSQIQLINCFGFQIIFSLRLTSSVFLITPESINDHLLYITEISLNNTWRELRFTEVYETTPAKRLSKLLKQNNFGEAEAFAKSFNLDINIVRKARAQGIVDKTVCTESDVNELLELLDAIKDVQFTLYCCLDVQSCCEKMLDLRRVLEFGCRELPNELVRFYWVFSLRNLHWCFKVSDVDISAMYTIVSDLLFRFDTYIALVRSTGGQYNLKSWLDFSGCDFIREIIFRLQNVSCQERNVTSLVK